MVSRRLPAFPWLVAAVLMTLQYGVAADKIVVDGATDWPQWLGPHRDGTSGVTGLQREWPAEGPVQVWRKPLGEGFSSIAVAGGALYTMFADGSGEYIVSLNANDGGERWRVRSGAQYIDGQGGNGPRSTPVVDGDLVFALGASGQLYAVRTASGEIAWMHDLQKEFGSPLPAWGFSGSPLVEGDLLLLELGGKQGRSLAAFDKNSGKVVWTGQEDESGYSSPIAATVNGLRQAVFFTAGGLIAVTPTDGVVQWRYPWHTSYNVNAATPLFIPPNRFFISSAYDVGASVLEVTRSDNGMQATTVWRNKTMQNKMATAVHQGGFIYGLHNSILKCIDAATGTDQWKERGYGAGTLVWADGLLLVLSDKGRLALVSADPTGHHGLASAQILNGLCWTAPSLANGRLYIRDMTEIVCLQLTADPRG